MVVFELKRIMFSKRFVLCIVIGMFIWLLILERSNTFNVDNSVVLNKELYVDYLKIYGGEVTDEKIEKLDSEIYRLEVAFENASKVLDDYYNGKVSRSDYNKASSQAYPYAKDLEILKFIKTQYNYAINSDVAKEVIDETGWLMLLSREYVNLVIPILLVIFLTPVFAADYESGMKDVTSTCKRGTVYCNNRKILASFIVSLMLCALFVIEEVIYFGVKYGYADCLTLIKNISVFEPINFNVPLITDVILVFLQMFCGCVLITFIISALCHLIKSKFFTIVTLLSIIILPVLFSEKELWFKYMLPVSFFSDGGYINGIEAMQLERMVIPLKGMLIYGIIYLIVILILYVVSDISVLKKKNVRLLMISALCIILTGCGADGVDNDDNYYMNQSEINVYEINDYFIYEEDLIFYIEKAGERILLDNNPVNELADYVGISDIYIDGTDIYYKLTREIGESNEEKIYRLNMENFEKTEVYANKDDTNSNHFDLTLLLAGSDFIIFSDYDGIYLYDTILKQEKMILPSVSNLSILNGKLYYTDNGSRLCNYDFSSSKSEVIIDMPISCYQRYGNGFLAIDKLDLQLKYYTDEKEDTIIGDKEIRRFDIYDNIIVYADYSNNLFLFDMDAKKDELIADNVVGFSLLKACKKVYYKIFSGEMRSVDLSTL